ncbi:MAG: hypothetical protein ACO2PM_00790 [Pyrobaculum sp.]|jgi:hypothetical protein
MVVKTRVAARDGRLVEVRFRANRRVAIRESELPRPPPREVSLMCMGEEVKMRLTAVQFGFAVYYMSADSERRLAELLERHGRVPCVLNY